MSIDLLKSKILINKRFSIFAINLDLLLLNYHTDSIPKVLL